MSHKLLVIGLDGASFNVLDALIEKGYLPNIERLILNGSRADLETTFPPITAVAWSSFMTGKNPGKHGIFEFIRRDKDSKREMAVNASLRRGRAVWDLLGQAGHRVIVHNFPCTYPPAEVNGLMVSDFMTPPGRRDFTHPSSLLAELEEKFGPYRLHLSQTYGDGNAQGVLDELFDELEYKAQVTEYLMNSYEWDAFFQYFWGTDRIQHELWHIIDEDHPRHDPKEARMYRERVYDYFHRADEIIGKLIALAGDPQTWIVSDHGFGPAHKYCSFNLWLLDEGFLKLKSGALARIKKILFRLGITPELAFKLVKKIVPDSLRPSRGVSARPGASRLLSSLFLSFNDVDWSRTVAFSKGNYGQIFVNLEGREPAGSVAASRYDSVCEKIIERLRALRDPETGEAWVSEVFRRGEIYKGPMVEEAPDIAFLPRDMRCLPMGNADFTSNKFMVDAFGISGCHRMHGVMVACGANIKSGVRAERASIYDIAPTMLYLLDKEVPSDMDGQALREIISEEYLDAHPIRLASADGQEEKKEIEFTSEENEDVLERLRGLGYIA